MILKLTEHICALFPTNYYTFPEGEYKITISKKTYLLNCKKVTLLRERRFEINDEFNKLYRFLESNDQYFIQRFPYSEERGILLLKDYFLTVVEKYFKKNDLDKKIMSITESYFCIYIIIEHDYNGARENAINYININQSGTGEDWLKVSSKYKNIYFSVVEKFYQYIMIIRSPYINVTDINYKNIDSMFTYYCWEDRTLLTKVNYILFNHFEPKFDDSNEAIQDFFDKNKEIPLEDFFIAKAKVYERLHNYSMAIIHTVIALEIVVPKFINIYLKSKGVDSKSISDFDNKFGLSVRVKSFLKIILETKYHEDIKKVGTIIGFRNKIMHEGRTKESFNNVDIKELILSSESLILELKERTKQLEG